MCLPWPSRPARNNPKIIFIRYFNIGYVYSFVWVLVLHVQYCVMSRSFQSTCWSWIKQISEPDCLSMTKYSCRVTANAKSFNYGLTHNTVKCKISAQYLFLLFCLVLNSPVQRYEQESEHIHIGKTGNPNNL